MKWGNKNFTATASQSGRNTVEEYRVRKLGVKEQLLEIKATLAKALGQGKIDRRSSLEIIEKVTTALDGFRALLEEDICEMAETADLIEEQMGIILTTLENKDGQS